MNCYIDNRQCDCKDADECGRDPFRGPEDNDTEADHIIAMAAALDDKD